MSFLILSFLLMEFYIAQNCDSQFCLPNKIQQIINQPAATIDFNRFFFYVFLNENTVTVLHNRFFYTINKEEKTKINAKATYKQSGNEGSKQTENKTS